MAVGGAGTAGDLCAACRFNRLTRSIYKHTPLPPPERWVPMLVVVLPRVTSCYWQTWQLAEHRGALPDVTRKRSLILSWSNWMEKYEELFTQKIIVRSPKKSENPYTLFGSEQLLDFSV